VSVRLLARAAIYAALYAALTLAPGLNALAYGQVQFRLSESLLVFACVDPAAVVGLTVGTALGNVNSSLGPADIVVGALLTLAAALFMHSIGPRWWALAAPVVVNGLGVAAELTLLLHLPYWVSAAWVAAGEAAVMATGAALLLVLIKRHAALFGLTLPAA